MAAPALFVHVPVDRIEIFGGPGAREWMEIRDQLIMLEPGLPEPYIEVAFRLRTGASERFFIRKLKLASIFAPHSDYTWRFTAVFCGQNVSGVYNIQARAGWFRHD